MNVSSGEAEGSSVTQKQPSLLSSLRLWTFSASLTPVILGVVLSYRTRGNIDPLLFFLTLAAVLTVNGAGNMVNSYFEQTRKLNSATSSSNADRRSLGNGRLIQRSSDVEGDDSSQGINRSISMEENLTQIQLYQTSLVNYAAGMYGIGMLCMLFLMHLSPAKSEHIAALFFGGLSSSFIYTGGVGLSITF